jgi:uncharacterized protein YdhG (YjbR/CyaY superfamily)
VAVVLDLPAVTVTRKTRFHRSGGVVVTVTAAAFRVTVTTKDQEGGAPMARPVYGSVDAYIASFPATTQKILNELRQVIRAEALAAEERISYGMPAYFQEGPLVYFAGYAKHIGLYPTASGIKAFALELSGFRTSTGAVQFPLGAEIPWEIIRRIVRYRIAENLKNARAK